MLRSSSADRSFPLNRDLIGRATAVSSAILVVVVALDYFINVLLFPGAAPYTPLTTIAITLVVAPAFTYRLLAQGAKIRAAEQALAGADAANAAKTRFLAHMSHELRTPLNAIVGYAEILEETAIEQRRAVDAEDARRIQGAAHHLLALIGGILDHAKAEAGKVEMHRAPTALEPMLAEVADTVRALADKHGTELVLECEPNLGEAVIDRLRVKQCMLNLASNAVKFTKGGRVTMRLLALGLDRFAFEVKDTGIGMSEETLSRLFAPFVQAQGRDEALGGAGLGLAITKQLLQSMGGTIAVSSAPGKGSTFTMTAPRGVPSASAKAA